MKVALVRRESRPHGGVERVTARVAAELVKAGLEVALVAHRWDDVPPGVRFQRVPLPPGPKSVRTLAFALGAPRVARSHGTIVHSFDRLVSQDLYRVGEGVHREWLLRRRRHFPRHETLLDPIKPLHRVILAIERRAFGGGARLLVPNSHMVAGEIHRHYRPAAPAHVVRTGVDLDHFHPDRRAALRPATRRELGLGDETVFLFIGSGFRRKGLALLLAALARVRGVVRLLVIGGDRAGPYRRLAETLGMADRVRFLGVVDDPLAAYAAADVFILPSLYDPAANTCLEAMALGLPVVTTRANGSGELIESDRTGCLIEDPTDAAAFAAGLAPLLDPRERVAVGARARAAVEAFPWSRHIDEVLGLYARLR
ncbi:MAG: glycosyltransferase family 4 protein [Candidatus Rokuibacteriota bacterium]